MAAPVDGVRRRTLLWGTGSAVAGVLAGYSVVSDPGLVPEPLRGYEYRDATETEYDPTLPPAPGVALGDGADTSLLATVGDRADVLVGGARGPHDVALVNDAEERRDLAITVSAGGRQVCSLTPSVGPGDVAVVGLLEPARYAVDAGLPGATEAFEVPPDRFDCNASATYLVVAEDGSVESTGSATTMGCGPLSDL